MYLQVAGMMHSLFTAFDLEVKRLGLFKMDTVGDAYICAGFIHEPTRPADRVCADVLAAGRCGAESAWLPARLWLVLWVDCNRDFTCLGQGFGLLKFVSKQAARVPSM